jgi:hypothetical protein
MPPDIGPGIAGERTVGRCDVTRDLRSAGEPRFPAEHRELPSHLPADPRFTDKDSHGPAILGPLPQRPAEHPAAQDRTPGTTPIATRWDKYIHRTNSYRIAQTL